MKLSQIKDELQCQAVLDSGQDPEFLHVFASDLMSDALALFNEENGDTTIFLTGLCNTQALRTAEMLDLHTIIFVKDKVPDEEMIETAKDLDLDLFTSPLSMFEACGALFKGGMKP